ncbi:MAG: hypothetical protein ACE5HP_09080 [Gemmatimonadota bacterium]
MTQPTIEGAQEELTKRVMALPGVVGTAIGSCDDAPCIKVYVVTKSEELTSRIPSTYQGFPVAVEETGEIRAREDTTGS